MLSDTQTAATKTRNHTHQDTPRQSKVEDLRERRWTKRDIEILEVLSILRVMAYELMWSPTGQDMAVRGVEDLMDKCTLAMKFEKSWISAAVTRMRDGFEKAHADWDRKREAHRKSKLRARDEADDAEGDPHGPVPAARPKGHLHARYSLLCLHILPLFSFACSLSTAFVRSPFPHTASQDRHLSLRPGGQVSSLFEP